MGGGSGSGEQVRSGKSVFGKGRKIAKQNNELALDDFQHFGFLLFFVGVGSRWSRWGTNMVR